jgi:hypothetical protein
MKALRRWLYRGTLSFVICFLISLMLYNRTKHVNVKYHKPPAWNCHSEGKHSISIGILIPSTTKYINMCSIAFIVRFILSLNISVFINWAWYINIVTVNERIYIMVIMQLSVSIDCPFLIATFSSICMIFFTCKQ